MLMTKKNLSTLKSHQYFYKVVCCAVNIYYMYTMENVIQTPLAEEKWGGLRLSISHFGDEKGWFYSINGTRFLHGAGQTSRYLKPFKSVNDAETELFSDQNLKVPSYKQPEMHWKLKHKTCLMLIKGLLTSDIYLINTTRD